MGMQPPDPLLRSAPARAAVRRMAVAAALLLLPLSAPGGEVHEYELDNGLTVLVQSDERADVAVSMLWYQVGSSHEHRPITGISHIVEHMMFKGTEERPPGELSRLIAREGGRHNAFTSRDYTGYFQMLAADRLELAFELEADRMHQLAFDPEEFRREMQVVREERRQRVDDPPESRAFERFTATAHMASPYRHPIIGWQRDLERIELDEAERWYERWYAPSNATLVVVGSVEPEKVLELAERHFGEVPAQETEPPPAGREIAADPGKRRVELSFADARVPLVYLAYNAPSLATADQAEDAYALLMAAEILDGGRSARLPQELVRGTGVATGAWASYRPIARLDTLLSLGGRPADGADPEALEQALREQVERLREEPVAEAELERAVTRLLASEIYERDSMLEQARLLGRLETAGIGWPEAERLEARIRAVTPEDIQRVARRYLAPERLTVGWLQPEEETE